MPVGTGPDIVADGLFGSETLFLEKSRFERTFSAVCPEVELPEVIAVLPTDTSATNRLQARIVALLNNPGSAPSSAVQTAEELMVLVGDGLQHKPVTAPNAVCSRRIAKQAQAFIEARYADPIHIEDLCRATGVGVRSLQRAFRSYFDVTVTEYIKTIRLDMAYRTLHAAHASEHTVAEVALEHGFSHLGRFSVMYGERFGESPSVTLAAHPPMKAAG